MLILVSQLTALSDVSVWAFLHIRTHVVLERSLL